MGFLNDLLKNKYVSRFIQPQVKAVQKYVPRAREVLRPVQQQFRQTAPTYQNFQRQVVQPIQRQIQPVRNFVVNSPKLNFVDRIAQKPIVQGANKVGQFGYNNIAKPVIDYGKGAAYAFTPTRVANLIMSNSKNPVYSEYGQNQIINDKTAPVTPKQMLANTAQTMLMVAPLKGANLGSKELTGLSKVTPDVIQAGKLANAARATKYGEVGINTLKNSAVGAGFMGSQAYGENKSGKEIAKSAGQGALFGGGLSLGGEAVGVGVSKIADKINLAKAIRSVTNPELKQALIRQTEMSNGFYGGPLAGDFSKFQKAGKTFINAADGKKRFEVGDENFKIKNINTNPGTKLSDVIDHKDLFRNYPDLKNVNVKNESNPYASILQQSYKGGWDPKTNTISIGNVNSLDEMKTNLIHEIQHVIQDKEGFASGGNPSKMGMDAYQRLAGEIEARDVSNRLGYNDILRARNKPYSSQDIPLKDWIVTHDTNSARSIEPKPGEVVSNGEIKPPTIPKTQIKPTVAGKVKPSPTNLTQDVSFAPSIAKERQFVKTVRETPVTAPEVAAKIKGKYTPITNAGTLTDAQKSVKINYDISKQRVLTEPLTAETNAIGQEIMRQSQNAGRFDEAIDIAEQLSKKGTESGQGIQAFSIWSKMTPEGMLRYATKTIDDANKSLGPVSKAVRKFVGKYDEKITPEDAKFITNQMKKAQNTADEFERSKIVQGVFDRINKKIPWGVNDVMDTYRYNNMLSNPLTHLRNAVSNLGQTFITRPATIAAEGRPLQAVKYEIGALQSLPDALKSWGSVMKNPKGLTKLDEPMRVRTLGRWNTPSDLMEAGDVFFKKLIQGGETAIGTPTDKSSKLAEYSLFRGGLHPEGQGILLNKIDDITKATYQLRKVGLGWFIPFIRTPMNVAKQWIEYSPAGVSTLPGATSKRTQLAKVFLGSMATALGAKWAMEGKVTWQAPTDPKQKELFYATGRKPFSVKIGNKWVPLQTFGVFAFALGLPASYKYHTEESKTALADSDYEKMIKIAMSSANFWSQQTFTSGLGSFVKLMEGDQDYNLMRNLTQPLGQLKPMQGMLRYISTLVDPVFRKPKGMGDLLKEGVPGLTKGMEAYVNPLGEESKRNITNFVAPYGMGQEDKRFEQPYKDRTIKLQTNALISKMKEDVKSGKGGMIEGFNQLPDGRYVGTVDGEIKEFKDEKAVNLYQFEKELGTNDENKAQYTLDYQRAKRKDDLNGYLKITEDRFNYLEKYKTLLDPVADKKKLIAIQNEQEDLQYYADLYGGYGGFSKPKKGKVSAASKQAKKDETARLARKKAAISSLKNFRVKSISKPVIPSSKISGSISGVKTITASELSRGR